MYIVKKSHIKYSCTINRSKHIIRFGKFGIKVLSFGRLTKTQLHALERSLIQKSKNFNNKSLKIWNLVVCNLQLTKFSSESRMGKGKGSIYAEAIYLKPGAILFEFHGLTNQQMDEIFKFINKKISFKLVLIKKKY